MSAEAQLVARETAQLVETLRTVLPEIRTDWTQILHGVFDDDRVIDCEWDPDTGALHTIGVGNHQLVVQVDWREQNALARTLLCQALTELVGRGVTVYHNADADLRAMRKAGIPITVEAHARLEDTMLAHGVLHSEEEHTLEYLSAEYGKLPPYKHLRTVAGAEDVYNAADLVETLYAWQALEPELAADPAAEVVYREERLALLPRLIEDTERGIAVNKREVYGLRDTYETRREEGARLAQAYAGWAINVGSPDQLKTWLYDVAGFPVQHAKAKPGEVGPATIDKDALAALRRLCLTEWDPDKEPTLEDAEQNILAGGHPLLEARYLFYGAQQTLSHYIDHCFDFDAKGQIVGVRDRIYPETRQHVQASGRHSIVGPALQQLKGKSERMICPDPGHVWLGWDWSNIETWMLGVLAGDDLILAAKAQGWDTHTLNFCDITGVAYPPLLTKALHTDPTCNTWREALGWRGDEDERRTFAKRFVYRLHYRGRPESAADIPGARQLGFDARRLVEASARYLAKHPAIPAFWLSIEKQVDKYGVVYAFLGMPRRLTSPYRNQRYREACNHPLQAGVGHIYNRVRLGIHRAAPWLKFAYGKHDSQWWSCPVERVDEAWAVIKPIVLQEWSIAGQRISFPASFKERRD